jgi:tripartite-type tricarboxylate transporter receptor subunit TctC
MVHVPYRGDAPALTDLFAGQVQVYFGSPQASVEQIRAGRLRALAVTTATRLETLPDIPTVSEFLPRLRGEWLEWRRRAQQHPG